MPAGTKPARDRAGMSDSVSFVCQELLGPPLESITYGTRASHKFFLSYYLLIPLPIVVLNSRNAKQNIYIILKHISCSLTFLCQARKERQKKNYVDSEPHYMRTEDRETILYTLPYQEREIPGCTAKGEPIGFDQLTRARSPGPWRAHLKLATNHCIFTSSCHVQLGSDDQTLPLGHTLEGLGLINMKMELTWDKSVIKTSPQSAHSALTLHVRPMRPQTNSDILAWLVISRLILNWILNLSESLSFPSITQACH